MRIQTLVAGACAAALIPTIALAQQTCEQRQSNRVAETLVGAGIGAIAGNAIAGQGNRNEGAVLGGVTGALIGNQIAKSKPDCARAYGSYYKQGAWHANSLARGEASGYLGRDGGWVDGAPRGYYGRDGHWVQAGADASASGYYANNLWVPASAGGYYARTAAGRRRHPATTTGPANGSQAPRTADTTLTAIGWTARPADTATPAAPGSPILSRDTTTRVIGSEGRRSAITMRVVNGSPLTGGSSRST